MKRLAVFALAMISLPAWAADDSARYQACVGQAESNPQAALATANAWQNGGTAAAHCAALALVGLKRYGEAAAKLDTLARSAGLDLSLRGEILGQAGNAWLLAGNAKNADASFAAELILNPRDPDAFTDAARAKAALKDWAGAESHLTAALAINARRPDLLVLRASARHALKKTVEARADLEKALALQPGMPDALVERGEMKREAGDGAGARADWQAAARGNGEAADAARKFLSETP